MCNSHTIKAYVTAFLQPGLFLGLFSHEIGEFWSKRAHIGEEKMAVFLFNPIGNPLRMKVSTSPQQQNQSITALISVHLKSAKATLLLHEMAQRLCGTVIREPGSKYRDQFQLPFLPLSKVV